MKQNYAIKRISPFSKREHTMQIIMDPADYNKWQDGEPIQHALPYLTPDELEFLMTGTTPDEWNNTFNLDDTREDPKDD